MPYKKTILLFGLLLNACVLWAQYKVHFVITKLPAYHAANDKIYLVGSFNNWNPGDEELAVQTVDDKNQNLILQNKNKNYQGEQLTLHYSRPNQSQIILAGTNENRDSVYVVLDRLNKKYLLEEAAHLGRRSTLKM